MTLYCYIMLLEYVILCALKGDLDRAQSYLVDDLVIAIFLTLCLPGVLELLLTYYFQSYVIATSCLWRFAMVSRSVPLKYSILHKEGTGKRGGTNQSRQGSRTRTNPTLSHKVRSVWILGDISESTKLPPRSSQTVESGNSKLNLER